MIIFAIIGCAICVLVAIAIPTFVIAVTNGDAITIDDIHANDVLTGLILSVIFFVFIFSIAFMHFKFYPEKHGYTAIETEIEEVEDADSN